MLINGGAVRGEGESVMVVASRTIYKQNWHKASGEFTSLAQGREKQQKTYPHSISDAIQVS